MIIFRIAETLQNYLLQHKNAARKVSFVPTMGALHAGHLALIEECGGRGEYTICSIFINPTQFTNKADFDKYPVSIENDINLLEKAGCEVLFLPSESEIYPVGFQFRQYSLGYLEHILEGEFRPGHFQGVCQVVDRLLEIVCPDIIVLGEKDYQQCSVIRILIELLQLPLSVRIHSTVREEDGLAMSSRNVRLTADDRKVAPELYRTLVVIKNNISSNDSGILLLNERKKLIEIGFKVDYLEIADADTLLTASELTTKKIVLVAAFLHQVRLIDNLMLLQ